MRTGTAGRPRSLAWRWIWFVYPAFLIVAGSWTVYQINSSPGDAAFADIGLAVITWGLSGPVWLAVMGVGFMLLALTNGAGGVAVELLAAVLVFGSLGVVQLLLIRLVVRYRNALKTNRPLDSATRSADE